MVNSAESTLCTTVKENVKSAGYGNILDGTYCPGGEGPEFASLRNCPAGHYCDDPADEPKKCPAGYYCPAKVRSYIIVCPAFYTISKCLTNAILLLVRRHQTQRTSNVEDARKELNVILSVLEL
jgi:hypothetical protein